MKIGKKTNIIQQIQTMVRNGDLGAGTILPSERDLAEQYGVARATMRAVIDDLAETGIITRKKGCMHRIARLPAANSLLTDVVVILSSASILKNYEAHPYQERVYIINRTAQILEEQGISILSMHPDSFRDDNDIPVLRKIIENCPRGVLATDELCQTERDQAALKSLTDAGIPVAVHGSAPDMSPLNSVWTDHHKGAYLIADEIARRGCRSFLCLWKHEEGNYWQQNRAEGTIAALKKNHVKDFRFVSKVLRPSYIRNSEDMEEAARLFGGRLIEHLSGKKRIDAILTLSDFDAAICNEACKLFGLTPEKDILIGGYDNSFYNSSLADFTSPAPAVSIEKFNEKISASLANLITQPPTENKQLIIEPELIINSACTESIHADIS